MFAPGCGILGLQKYSFWLTQKKRQTNWSGGAFSFAPSQKGRQGITPPLSGWAVVCSRLPAPTQGHHSVGQPSTAEPGTVEIGQGYKQDRGTSEMEARLLSIS